MNRTSYPTLGLSLAMILAGVAWAGGSQEGAKAEELSPFTVLQKSNIDKALDATFEGQRIRDLLPERLEWQIREHNLKITLKPATKPDLPYDPRIVKFTEMYKGQPSVDPNTFMIATYTAGVPFPDIDLNDPLAGVKVVWNYTAAQPHGDHFDCPFTFNLVDGNVGIERIQQWVFARYYMVGRVTGDQRIVGDGSIYHKSLLFAQFPQDIKGLGTFSIRYWDPKLDDIWAYIRAVRRVRRLSGGAWMDPIGGTDHLQDDIETFNAHPSWYKQYKLLGKRNALAVGNSQGHVADLNKRWAWQRGAASLTDEFPRMDPAAPYWNPQDVWEIRPVYVVETVPPEYHPYSRKINYFDASNWRPYFAETYDKKGQFWKWLTFANIEWIAIDGYIDPNTGKAPRYMFSAWGTNIDFQRRHATFFNVPSECTMNPPGYTENDFTLAVLEAAGR